MRHNTTGTYEGTADLVEILIAESKFAYGWRPVRAAILYALRDMRPDDSDDDTVYLTPEQFQTWLAEAKALAKARGDGLKPADVLGLTAFQIRAMASGYGGKEATGVRSKAIALACAHYAAGMPLPIPAGDAAALDAWFRPRFGGVDRVVQWLGMSKKTLSDRLRGYSLRGEERVTREPEAYLIRALDWLHVVGPVCPYGPKPPVDIWPGQSKELSA